MKQISSAPEKRKTTKVIKFETRQTVIVRTRAARVVAPCALCSRETNMFSPNEYSRISGMTPREVYRQIENDECHYQEQTDGSILICENS